MAPVIRISDELFRRLQRYGVPLVDTPSSVIERVLDELEATKSGSSPANPIQLEANSAKDALPGAAAAGRERGLFLAPAHSENLHDTVEQGVPLDSIRDLLSDREMKNIEGVLNGAAEFRCWAMTESRRSCYSSMRSGDIVLFTEQGTGKFGYRGNVLGKIESQRLGEHLWRDTPNKPWKLIYFLGAVREVNIPKASLLKELGYDPNYVVPGIVRVSTPKINAALSRYGTLEDLLASVEGRVA